MNLEMLNRLRVNAGKPELKSWKASQSKLKEAVKTLQDAGFVDALPGANINATPVANDPKLIEPFTEATEEELAAQEGRRKHDEEDDGAPLVKKDPETTKVKTQLARGIETDGYAKHSRKAVQDHRRDEKKAGKEERAKVKLDAKDKKQVKDEADDRKKAPTKEERQTEIIKNKRAKREKEGKLKPAKEKNANEVTVAELAREVGMDPKIARAKLRRHEAKLEKLHTKGQDRWTFPKSAAAEIRKILKGEK